MIRFSINLPINRRLDLKLVKNRKASEEKPLIPDLGEVRRARKGSKVSRFFKHIFEHKSIKKILGANIALAIVAASFIPVNAGFDSEAEQTLVSAEITNFTTERGVQYPTQNVAITQGYRFFHPGIDFDGITGDSIYPVMAGRIEAISYSRYNYGNAIIINHGSNLTSLYAHLNRIFVEEGQEVTTKTVIGEMGATGRSYGDHLHLEVRDHGRAINPYSVLPR